MTLPAVETLGDDIDRTDGSVNLAVESPTISLDATNRDGAYHGPDAAIAGCFAAAHAVAETTDSVQYHGSDPIATANGPWVVLAPLAGHLATVSLGSGRAVVTLATPSGSVGSRLSGIRDRIEAVIEAAQPSHDDYPVTDDRGTFTIGMTTYSFDAARTHNGTLEIVFDVSVTPATTATEVEATFENIANVTAVTYTPISGVTVAAPGEEARRAVEDAIRDHMGDVEYEWLSTNGVFAHLPTPRKFALGTAPPDSAYDEATRDRDRDLVSSVVEALGRSR